MPFFRDLRRRSKASFHQDNASDESKSSGTAPTTRSTSTLNSSSTAPTTLSHSLSNLTISKLNGTSSSNGSNNGRNTPPGLTSPVAPLQRPSPVPAQGNKRHSMAGSFSSSMTPVPRVPESLYAPKVLSVSENSWVHTKVFLIYGQAGGQDQRPLDGTLTVYHHQGAFPPTTWQVCASHFKALVHLNPGPNEIRLEFSSPKLVNHNSSNTVHSSNFRLNFLPLTTSPPLHMAILVGSDSPCTFDAPPEKIQREGNDLDSAVRKYRMAGHLWAAFTAECMYRNGFGRRSFRFEEEWQEGTLSRRDMETQQMRNESKIHVIRSKKTVAEIRDLDVAQQWGPAQRKNDLWGWAMEDMKAYFKPRPGQTHHVAVLILDAHWDVEHQVIRAHAALGGGDGSMQVAVFGSQELHTYPSSLEDVVPALSDCTKTNTDFVAAEGGEDSGQHWQAACTGLGAHLHEVGHVLGCPHQSKGIMLQDYGVFNRTFLTREPYSTRTKQPGLQPCLPEHECAWHRLDALRFRSHPCFKLVTDSPIPAEDGVQVWAVDQGRLIVTAKSGISFVEIRPEGEAFCDTWVEYAESPEGYPRQVLLAENDLRNRLPPELKKKKLGLEIFSHGRGRYTVDDVSKAVVKVKMPKGLSGFLGPKYGQSSQPNTQHQDLFLPHAFDQKKLLLAVKVHYGFALDGMEFVYEDGSSCMFGKRGGEEATFNLDTRRGELLSGFFVRAGVWVDGIEVLTTLGRRSGFFGNATGGSGQTLMPPRGYSIAGISGSFGPCVDGFGLIIMR